LDLFWKEPGSYDLLITDFSMPKMQGDQLINEFRKIRKDFPAILCTGYHAELVKTEEIGGPTLTLKKPYENTTLAKVVKELLGP
jgi:CheY-like chemotaxis protein